MHIETRTDQVRIAFVSLHSCGRTVDSHDTAPILHPDLQCIQFWGSEDLVTNVLKEDDDVVLSQRGRRKQRGIFTSCDIEEFCIVGQFVEHTYSGWDGIVAVPGSLTEDENIQGCSASHVDGAILACLW